MRWTILRSTYTNTVFYKSWNTTRRSVHSSTPPRVFRLIPMERVDEAKASSQITGHGLTPTPHKERPITTSRTLYRRLSVGTAFRDKLLHSGLSWPRLWSLPPMHQTNEKNDLGNRDGKKLSHQRNIKLTKQTRKTTECANEHNPHTYPKRVRLPQAGR